MYIYIYVYMYVYEENVSLRLLSVLGVFVSTKNIDYLSRKYKLSFQNMKRERERERERNTRPGSNKIN